MSYMRQSGFGDYEHTGDWSWEYYPPPYDFLAPRRAAPMPAPVLYHGAEFFPAANVAGGAPRPPAVVVRAGAPVVYQSRGVGGCNCGGSCGGCHKGIGLFDSMDFSTWGLGEWGMIAVGAYLVVSLMGDTKRAARSVSRDGERVNRPRAGGPSFKNKLRRSDRKSSMAKRTKKPNSSKASPATPAMLAKFSDLFGGKITPSVAKSVNAELKKNPGGPGAFERCVRAVAARGTAASPRGVCASAGRKKYGKRTFQEMAAAGKRRAARRGNAGKRRNPEDAAAEAYEKFHGRPPEVVTDVRTTIHEHSVLSGIGKLKELTIEAVDGRSEVKLSNFKGALLAQDEAGKQLYIEGGDQSVNLADFGITRPHEHELLGAVTGIIYFTRKDHLRPEDGGTANYNHEFGTTRDGERHVEIKGSRLPVAIYDVRNKLIRIAGGTYALPEVGISG